MRYSRYRRRYLRPGMGRPTVLYYPIFWGRPQRPRPPRPPRPVSYTHLDVYKRQVDGAETDYEEIARQLNEAVAENVRHVPDWVSWKPLDFQANGCLLYTSRCV